MRKITIEEIKKLREKTGAGVMDVKRALEECKGDEKKARDLLRQRGLEKAEKRAMKEAAEGLISTYVHHSGKIAAVVELNCETDFVARTEEFNVLASEIAMQIASMAPKDSEELLTQDYIRDNTKKVKDLIAEAVEKTGEKIEVRRFSRFELGKE